jgi:hypothetical protein
MKNFWRNDKAIVFELLIAGAMAVILFFALMNIGTYINGTIGNSLQGASTTATLNNTLNNISNGYTSTISIMTVASIIVVITIPLAAVIAIRKLM